MPSPAAVMGDQIMGTCVHPIPAPPAPPIPTPMPFAAPLTMGLESTVLVSNKPIAVMGSSGYNSTPHPPTTDPFTVPTMQVGRVVSGSPTVMAGGKPVASMTSTVTCCILPGTLAATGATVLIA